MALFTRVSSAYCTCVLLIVFGVVPFTYLTRWSTNIVDSTKFDVRMQNSLPLLSAENTTNILCSKRSLFVRRSSTNISSLTLVGCARRVRSSCRLCIPRTQHIKEVIIEVGSNVNPEYGTYAKNNKNVFFIAVEPIPKFYDRMVSVMTSAGITNRFLAIPAAVAPGDGFTLLNEARASMCSSLLQMTNNSKTYGNCALLQRRFEVPRVSLDALVSIIPYYLDVSLISVDAQGYDLFVASTLTSAWASRVRIIALECQDLPIHGQEIKWLYKDTYNCETLRKCMEDESRTGKNNFILDTCANNHRGDPTYGHISEYNCFFRRPFVPSAEVNRYVHCSSTLENCRIKPVHQGVPCPL